MSDDKLDKVFKEAAEKSEHPFDPSAWEAMNKLLDEEPTHGIGGINRKLLSSIVAIGILIPALLYFVWNYQNENSTEANEIEQEKSLALNQDQPETEKGQSKQKEESALHLNQKSTQPFNNEAQNNSNSHSSNNAIGSITKEDQKEETATKEQAKKKNSTQEKEVQKSVSENIHQKNEAEINEQVKEKNLIQEKESQQKLSSITSVAKSERQKKELTTEAQTPEKKSSQAKEHTQNSNTIKDSNGESNKVERQAVLPMNSVKNQLTEVTNEEEKYKSILDDKNSKSSMVDKNSVVTESAENKGQPSIANLHNATTSAFYDTTEIAKKEIEATSTDNTLENNSSEQREEEEEVKTFPSQFGIKLALSPDFTSIGYSSVDKMGFNYGLLFEYQLKSNWILSSGAILSKKIYSGTDVEYTFKSNRYTANKLLGECRIIDIPLNVYYLFKPESDLTFFASVGVSSYLMLTEDYTYTINSSYGSKEYYQEVRGENKEWFKQLNISVGVQKRISNRIHLQFEPFLKAPLSGVGAGKVSLASFGAFLNMKYSFKRTRE